MGISLSRRNARILASVVLVAVVIALVRVLIRQGPAALDAWHHARVQWEWITGAILCAAAGHAASIMGWRRLLRDTANRLRWRDVTRLFLVGNLGRYLPAGKAWQIGIVSTIAADRGLEPKPIAACALLQGSVGTVVGALLLFVLGERLLRLSLAWTAVPLVGIVVLVGAPRFIRRSQRVTALIARKLPGFETISLTTMSIIVLASLASWCLWGCAFFALARGVVGAHASSVTNYLVTWIASLLAGVVAVVAPAGIGVRDTMMQLLLRRSGLPGGDALVLVLIARVWATLMEVVPATLVFLVNRIHRNGIDAPADVDRAATRAARASKNTH